MKNPELPEELADVVIVPISVIAKHQPIPIHSTAEVEVTVLIPGTYIHEFAKFLRGGCKYTP